jgi:four helix bundle protein
MEKWGGGEYIFAMQSFTDLKAWQRAMELVKVVYQITRKLPVTERYGLISQVQRASVSILANTAEGFGRYTFPDKANKYTIARGECAEVETLLHVMIELHFITAQEASGALELCSETGRMISGLIASCKSRS